VKKSIKVIAAAAILTIIVAAIFFLISGTFLKAVAVAVTIPNSSLELKNREPLQTTDNNTEILRDNLTEDPSWMESASQHLPVSKWELNSTTNELTFYTYDIQNETCVNENQGKRVGNYTIRFVHDTEFEKTRDQVRDYLGELKNNPDYDIRYIETTADGFRSFGNFHPTGFAELMVREWTPANRKIDYTTVNGWLIEVHQLSPMPGDRIGRIIYEYENAVKGIPFAVAKPSSDLLTQKVRIWKFDDNVTVSTQSAAEVYSKTCDGSGSSSCLMTAKETNELQKSNLGLVIEFNQGQDEFDMAYDPDSDSVVNQRTGEFLFAAHTNSSSISTGTKLSRFLESAQNESLRDTYIYYGIAVAPPEININPLQNITAGSPLVITGTTNLPQGTSLKGKLRPSLLYTEFKKPITGCYIIKTGGSMNDFSCKFLTEKSPYSEFFVTVVPNDEKIAGLGYSRLFTILPDSSETNSSFDIDYAYSESTDLKPCSTDNATCLTTDSISLDLFAHYDRVVLSYEPISLTITNITFVKILSGPWVREKVATIPTVLHRINENTVIVDPVENLCRSGFYETYPECGEYDYEMNFTYSYPNPAVNNTTGSKDLWIHLNYLWKDDAEPV